MFGLHNPNSFEDPTESAMQPSASPDTGERPTPVMANELQRAFDFFNDRLFHGVLPSCLITLQRERATFGYFSKRRFVRFDGHLFAHEIALNPAYFAARTLKSTLSTLCHEMVHLQQAAHGTAGRRGYHNAEWASWMDSIGLAPSDTGAPGGRRTGERVSHYILEGGAFDRAADALLDDHFVLSWIDRFPMAVPVGMHIPAAYRPQEDEASGQSPLGGNPAAPIRATLFAVANDEVGEREKSLSVLDLVDPADVPEAAFRGATQRIAWPADTRNSSNRTKYECPGCSVHVWGKPGLDLRCGHCGGRQFRVTSEARRYGARPG